MIRALIYLTRKWLSHLSSILSVSSMCKGLTKPNKSKLIYKENSVNAYVSYSLTFKIIWELRNSDCATLVPAFLLHLVYLFARRFFWHFLNNKLANNIFFSSQLQSKHNNIQQLDPCGKPADTLFSVWLQILLRNEKKGELVQSTLCHSNSDCEVLYSFRAIKMWSLVNARWLGS